MKKMIALGALLLSAASANCTSGNGSLKDGGAGAGGEAAGQPSSGGGDAAGDDDAGGAGARSSTDGGMTGEDDVAGQGGEAAGASGMFSITGTVYAPKGGDVAETVVIGCAWIDESCDDAKSQAVQVSKTGSSGHYALGDLESGLTYLILFWKDVNGTGDVDDGDYVGVVADESGAARAFTSAAAAADGVMLVKQAVVAADVPAELVGDWFTVAPDIGVTNAWTFNADGSASNGFTLNSSVCGGGAGEAINSQGVFSVDGNQLAYAPASGQKTVTPCSGPATTTAYYTSPRQFTWRVGPSTKQAGTALFLTDQQNPDHTEAEFQKL